VCSSVLQCVAVCCSVLQCVAVHCSVWWGKFDSRPLTQTFAKSAYYARHVHAIWTHSHMRRGLLIRITWIMYMYDMTYSYVRHIARLYVRHHAIIRMTYLYVRHVPFIYVGHDLFICGTVIVYSWDMTRCYTHTGGDWTSEGSLAVARRLPWVTSHIWMRHVTEENICIYISYIARVMGHVTRMNESWCIGSRMQDAMSHVAHMNESRHRRESILSRM